MEPFKLSRIFPASETMPVFNELNSQQPPSPPHSFTLAVRHLATPKTEQSYTVL
jgi:hypothetical protein